MRADDACTDTIWSEERIAILKQMWAERATAAAIAVRLGGLSRSAVLGKIHRLRRGAAVPAMTPNKDAAPAPCDAAALAYRRRAGRSAPRSSSRPRAKESPPRSSKTLLELTNDSCRFPHGEPGTRGFFFCGAPEADLEGGRPYCARHARLAYSSAAIAGEDDDEFVIALRNSPSIAPFDSPRRNVWRVPVTHPAPRRR
jgi:GcrA cell cycle regulator